MLNTNANKYHFWVEEDAFLKDFIVHTCVTYDTNSTFCIFSGNIKKTRSLANYSVNFVSLRLMLFKIHQYCNDIE